MSRTGHGLRAERPRLPVPAQNRAEYYRSIAAPAAMYLLTLLLFLGASFDTSIRLWGLNTWAYLPVFVRIALFACGLVVGGSVVIGLAPRAGPSSLERREWKVIWTWRLVLTAIGLAAAFVVLRAQAHYLGDGYNLLSTLAGGALTLKARDAGSALVLNSLYALLPGPADRAALWTYRIVSMAAGCGFMLLAWWAAARLFADTWARVLFALGVCTGGITLMFFGYVENYALRGLALATFTLGGVLIARGTWRRVWILPLLLWALSLHLTTLALVPAALYLALSDTRVSRRINSMSLAAKIALATLTLAIGIGGFVVLADRWLYFRLAFVPPWPTQFTMGGYTLLTLQHVGDVVNLVLILVPGTLVLIAGRTEQGSRKKTARRDLWFLRILVISTLTAAFFLDPKLGMPRDWDLFAFPGIPLAVFLFLTTLDSDTGTRRRAVTAGLAISLGLLSLGPRAWVQSRPALAVEQIKDYVRLDPRRSRVALNLVGRMARANGDTSTVTWAQQTLAFHFKDDLWLQAGTRLLARGDVVGAREHARSVVMLDPTRPAGWLLLAKTHRANGAWDSSLVAAHVADALNPHSAPVLTELGIAYYNIGQFQKAEALLLEAVEMNADVSLGWRGLAIVAGRRGDQAARHEYLQRAAHCADAEADLILALVRSHVDRVEFAEAAWTLRRYATKTGDTARVRRLLQEYPNLAKEYVP